MTINTKLPINHSCALAGFSSIFVLVRSAIVAVFVAGKCCAHRLRARGCRQRAGGREQLLLLVLLVLVVLVLVLLVLVLLLLL